MRLAPVVDALAAAGASQALLDHAGLLSPPAGGPPPTHQPAVAERAVAEGLEYAFGAARPRLVILAGDGDATLTAALAACRHGVPIARLGAGLRCRDRTLSSEINRMVLDELADVLLTDGHDASAVLTEEGADPDAVRCVGSTLPDAVARWRDAAQDRAVWRSLGLTEGRYVLATLHEPENVGDAIQLGSLADGFVALARRTPLVLSLSEDAWPLLEPGGQRERLRAAGARLTGALDYLDFLSIEMGAAAVVTDAAGVQEETTVLGIRCFTIGRSERNVTLTQGTNVLLDDAAEAIAELRVPAKVRADPGPIPLWDGKASARVAAELLSVAGAAS